jgi:RNA-directed DNA polymerase
MRYDFVILSRGKAVQALDWTRRVVIRLGLTLNDAKTSIKQARKESFDFLGYTFGPHCFEPDGRWYLGASPSKKSVSRIKQKVGDLLVPNNVEPWPEVRDRLNQILRGWCAYFSYGTTAQAYRAVDYYVYESVRHYLRRRHQVRSRGTNSCFSRSAVYGPVGRCSTASSPGEVSFVSLAVKSSRKAGCGKSARPVVCPAKAGMFSGRHSLVPPRQKSEAS